MYVASSDATSKSSSMSSEHLLIEVLARRPGTTIRPLTIHSPTRTPGHHNPTTPTTTNPSSAYYQNLVVTTTTPSDVTSDWTESSITATTEIVVAGGGIQLPVGVVIVIVLAAACFVLGAIYGYIYFTRIGPEAAGGSTSSGKKRKTTGGSDRDHHHGGGDCGPNDGSSDAPFKYTHVFFFRKPTSHHRAATIT